MALSLQQVGLSFIDISHKPKIREVDHRLQKLRPFHMQNQNWDHRFYCIIRFFFFFFFFFFFHLRYLITTKQFGLKDDFLEALLTL